MTSKEPIILTKVEKIILKNIDKQYKWIVRDRDGNLYVFENKPIKRRDFWGFNSHDFCYSHLFQFMKWEDEEPYLIKDLLKGE